MRKLVLLAAMLAMVLLVAAPALAQQGGGQYATNIANAVNECAQNLEQSAEQNNDIDQYNQQALAQLADVDVDDIAVAQLADVDGEDAEADLTATIDVGNAQYALQVGNVAAPVQDVTQVGVQGQDCSAEADAFTFQFQRNLFTK